MGWRRRRKPAAVGAPAAADDHGFRAGNSRHPSSARAVAVLRGSARAREKTHRRILETSACRNISAISSGCCRTMAASIVTGRRLTYVDLSLFQIVEGLRYAFPRRMKAFEREIPGLSTCTTVSPHGPISRPISPATAASPSTRTASSGVTRRWICSSFRDVRRPDPHDRARAFPGIRRCVHSVSRCDPGVDGSLRARRRSSLCSDELIDPRTLTRRQRGLNRRLGRDGVVGILVGLHLRRLGIAGRWCREGSRAPTLECSKCSSIGSSYAGRLTLTRAVHQCFINPNP